MEPFDWGMFLRGYNDKILASDLAEELPEDVRASGWLGQPGATEAQIAQAEARLGITFPPSYRAFLAVSNGWWQPRAGIEKLWSTEEIEWFAVRHQDWIEIWTRDADPVADADYFVYGPEQRTYALRADHLQTALEISTNEPDVSSIFLLNPRVVTPEGEWEAWLFANWLPGARRWRSFQEMIVAEFERIR